MPAIDAALPATPTPGPSAPTEARPATQNAAKGQKMADGDTQASDAFIAALLAQSTAQVITPEQAVATPDAAPMAVTGQDLPTLRPGLAAGPAARRPLTPAATDSAPAAATPATTESAQDDFASAFVALQDAMTGGGSGGERRSDSSLDTDGSGGLNAGGLVSDLSQAVTNTPARAEADVRGALDALTGAHAARAHEAPASAQAYAAKPAPLPMDQPAMFAERLNQHVSFMIGDQIQSAQIAVTPADLGPVEVRVTMVGDEAKIQLSATHAATREALNEALPRLRASFAEAGISLSQAGVFTQLPERQQADPSFTAQARGNDGDFEAAPLTSVAPSRSLKIGLIDAFV